MYWENKLKTMVSIDRSGRRERGGQRRMSTGGRGSS